MKTKEMIRLSLGALAGAALLAVSPLAFAAPEAQPQNVVSFNASANVEVTKDLLAITLNTTKEGPDAASVQAALKQALDAALAEARKTVQPGQMDVRTGNFSLYPRYTQQGKISGWNGTAELVLEGRDMPRITQAAGRIQTLSVAHVMQSLSREAREKVEGDATQRAIANYRAKALEYARQFGFAGYALREVNISTHEPGGPPIPVMRAKAMMAAEDAPVPVEAGKGLVTVTVSGSVMLN